MDGFGCDPRHSYGDGILGCKGRGRVVVWRVVNKIYEFRGCSVRQRTIVVLLVVLFILAASGATWSQTVQGVITGTVTDPTGAVVPGATVTITNAGTNIT